ncbi:MAG: sortase [Anaerolineales bacterium]
MSQILDLDQLDEGDLVILFSARQSYTYAVEDVLVVEPDQVQYLESNGEPITTLISCYPYMVDNKRIIVIAKLVDG